MAARLRLVWLAGLLCAADPASALSPGEAVFCTLEEPPTVEEVAALWAQGSRTFDIDLTKPGAEAAARTVKALGGEMTAYHTGGGGGRAWGSVRAGEGVRKFMAPEDLAQLTREVRELVALGAGAIHFDNTHRLSGKRLEAVADAIISGGARIVPKNNADRWSLALKRRPDLLRHMAYAIMEDTIGEEVARRKAMELAARGLPLYVVAFGRKVDGSAGTSAADAEAWALANPWAMTIWMPDERAFDGRTARRVGGRRP